MFDFSFVSTVYKHIYNNISNKEDTRIRTYVLSEEICTFDKIQPFVNEGDVLPKIIEGAK